MPLWTPPCDECITCIEERTRSYERAAWFGDYPSLPAEPVSGSGQSLTMCATISEEALAAKFGTYVLPGRVTDPERGIAETQDAEKVGLGTAWLSERFALKDSPSLNGAMAQATSRIKIGGTSYFLNRHPVSTVSYMATMQAISNGRFRLIFARSGGWLMHELGLPSSTFRLMTDLREIFLKLYAGETVRYQGPAGDFPRLRCIDIYEGPPPPMILTATGPKTLAFAGRTFDGVLLHPMLTTDAVARCAKIVRDGALSAGRDPESVRVLANVVVAPDLDPAEEQAVVGGRAVTYLHSEGYGEMLVDLNGWDHAVLSQLRDHPTFTKLGGEHADQSFTREQLVASSRILPRIWYETGAAVGSARRCAVRLREYLDAGAHEIVLHGSAPNQMGPLMQELKKVCS